jgi:RimJ/RimL family protein N-acetyltransferase
MENKKSPRSLFPEMGLRGSKTLLTVFKSSDITDLYLSWLNDPIIVRYSNQRFINHNESNSRFYLDSFEGTDNLFLLIQDLDELKAIGTLTIYTSMIHETSDIGILIGEKTKWGNGYGLDAWQTTCNWLISTCNMRKITGGTLSGNEGMRRIFKKSGMHEDGKRLKQEIVDKTEMDIVYYAKFRNE